ncbi:hypothetical protein GNZ12_35210 [Paraburkholderia sp. 1N]|uniref:Lysylphosphatidylglycerol synthase-like protein n=1 Tax=Paraburkholderia solitsugae TaxID=2675748 RepID=A0ABX2C0D0_9BURK|nr:lysylphosphatidylglycerol synthase domain-containing protein [Paraburkholderia solitsugae]NPT46476.1 hypothetical protein [Paraburkholderia solitsugae]
MKWLQRMGLPAGIALLLYLVLHDGGDIVHTIRQAGPTILWLVPLHALPLLLDACGWRTLLGKSTSLLFLWWIATVREAVSRLLPVASIGGEIVGIRLANWKAHNLSSVSASVIVEVLVTMMVQYAFSAIGLVLLLACTEMKNSLGPIALAVGLSLALPAVTFIVVRRGGVFHAIERWAARLLGAENPLLQAIDGIQLDTDIDALMSRGGLLIRSFLWQFAGYALGALETYWALSMLGHSISPAGAVAIEALTQAVRHAAFIIPAGIGVQEAAVVLLGQMFGVDREAALSLALVKRVREGIFGCCALASCQVAEILIRRPGEVAAAQAANQLPDDARI